MNATITPSPIFGELTAPPSKSYAQRVLLAAFLSGEETKIQNLGDSADVCACLNALNVLGAEYYNENGILVCRRTALRNHTIVSVGESATLYRFLLPVLSALGLEIEFTGKKSLFDRPVSALKAVLTDHGIAFSDSGVSGKLSSGTYSIQADISSQYISGLLFALPLLNGDSEILLQGKKVSAPYIRMTVAVLRAFGVIIEETEKGYFIQGGQTYRSPKEMITVEGDYSGAAFLLSLGALGGCVSVNNLLQNSLQGDKEILSLLQKFGATIKATETAVTVQKGELQGVEVDCEDIPDLVPVLAVVGAYSKGQTLLKNVERLKIKESDRVAGVLNLLESANIQAEYTNGNLKINGGTPKGGTFFTQDDHRIAMAGAVLSAFAKGNSTLDGIECVEKSYPSFFQDFERLGGKIRVGV
ncbi:MAG: 3-phosphoshikimate 1-carboxyvinyltransferase [Clostridia bacterium]|nr:3-phosphoshikimate 1-carboxyvinyltransferase [Clostridia bacterium]